MTLSTWLYLASENQPSNRTVSKLAHDFRGVDSEDLERTRVMEVNAKIVCLLFEREGDENFSAIRSISEGTGAISRGWLLFPRVSFDSDYSGEDGALPFLPFHL